MCPLCRINSSPVGLSAHDPTLIETAEEKGWDVDYSMTALYFLSRTKEEQRVILWQLQPWANARASWVLSKRSPDTYLIGMGRSP